MTMPVLALLLLLQVGGDRLPAFPGAEGAGAYTRGGRGGKVLFVTSLADSGPGSLRAAVDAEGPRIVIFRVSGVIRLEKDLKVRNPHLTIAGQTAPGDGICLAGRGLLIRADQVIVRYLRSRPGDVSGKETDGIEVTRAKDVIVDHCSVSWATDEALSVTGEGTTNVTVQWCLITESLNDSVHAKGEHGYGSLIRTDGKVTYHHNLYAHHKSRCPRPGTYGKRPGVLDFRNNVVYDWGSMAGYTSADPAWINYVGNFLKRGPSTRDRGRMFVIGGDATRMFVKGNLLAGHGDASDWDLIKGAKDLHRAETAFKAGAVRSNDVRTAYRRVLAEAGATRPFRDVIDRRVVDQVLRGGGRIIDSQKDVGGWPPYGGVPPALDSDDDGIPDGWESRHGLNPADGADARSDADGDGYSNLEEYLNRTDPRKRDLP